MIPLRLLFGLVTWTLGLLVFGTGAAAQANRCSCDKDEECRPEQYCASDNACREDGSCVLHVDCIDLENQYAKPRCVGYGQCEIEEQTCEWICGDSRCIDLKGVDLGACEMLLGYGVREGSCMPISGCGAGEFVFFETQAECQRACATPVPPPPPYPDPTTSAFMGLGDLSGGDGMSIATDVDGTGNAVVGWSRDGAGDRAFYWTVTDGMTALGGEASRSQAISPDGAQIVGSVEDVYEEMLFTKDRAAVQFWLDGQYTTLIGETFPDTDLPFFWFVDATVAVDHGPIYGTCLQYGGYGVPIGCRYDAPGELVPLTGISYINDADAAGNVAGTLISDPRSGEPPVAVLNGDPLGYPADAYCDMPRYCVSEAQAFNADASIVVGTSSIPAPDVDPANPQPDPLLWATGFVYTTDQGMTRLPDLRGGTDESGAYAVDSTGRIIAGFGTSWRGQRAVVWLDGRPVPLARLLRQTGGRVPWGWTLREVRAMTADGRVMVGNGENPAGQPEAFRVVLPPLL